MIEAAHRAETWLRWQRDLGSLDASRSTLDAHGDVVRFEEADGSWTEFDYDSRRRLTATRRSSGERVAYAYSDLDQLSRRGCHRFEYDPQGRVARVSRGNAGGVVFRYDEAGRVVQSRTSMVSLDHAFDAGGRFRSIRQTIDGVTIQLRFEYDEGGRLGRITFPGGRSLRYVWTDRGWPSAVSIDGSTVASWSYRPERRCSRVLFASGVEETSIADATDARPVSRDWSIDGNALGSVHYRYNELGQVVADGERSYHYDGFGRLTECRRGRGLHDPGESRPWRYDYDATGNLLKDDAPGCHRDAQARLEWKLGAYVTWTYRYDDAGQLIEVLANGALRASLAYDAKGRLAVYRSGERDERYLYGPADELLATTDARGDPLRLWIRTPSAIVAEIASGTIRYLHQDPRGTTRLVSDGEGVVTELEYDPFGLPLAGQPGLACYHGRLWFPEIGLYYFGARWYDPALGQFLTPDTYTAAPDDIRILNPLNRGGGQAVLRALLVESWRRRPHLRNRLAFCGNDPVNNSDPNGHWSFFGVLLSILLAIWTLPNTLFGLLIEITCLIGEVFRWLLALISGGSIDWESVGFDAASSGRLNAFALVFEGGWLGSFSSLLGITFGNVFFVNKQWRTHPHITATSTVSPAAYGGAVTFPRSEALYEHELRHTNQYGWFGPFFHLGLPIFGVYEWDIIFNGYANSWLETDATNHGGI